MLTRLAKDASTAERTQPGFVQLKVGRKSFIMAQF